MLFCTAINCIDGRTQLPVIEYLKKRFNVEYVDMVTEPGPNLLLAKGEDTFKLESVISRCDISVEKHLSSGIAIVGHYDCAGNPAPKEEQLKHIEQAIAFLNERYKNEEVIGLWLDSDFKVHEQA
ncbi:carbonic anhydrase [Thermodesulfobacteriota bacterium]